MYAVIALQGFQYRVEPDEHIQVPLVKAEVGQTLTVEEVYLVSDGERVEVGRPVVPGALVEAEVVAHLRGPKIIVGKYKRRRDYRRRKGHRSDLTELRIRRIQMPGHGAKSQAEAQQEAPAMEGETSHGA
jgi:large subunit ribosomal protein L21